MGEPISHPVSGCLEQCFEPCFTRTESGGSTDAVSEKAVASVARIRVDCSLQYNLIDESEVRCKANRLVIWALRDVAFRKFQSERSCLSERIGNLGEDV